MINHIINWFRRKREESLRRDAEIIRSRIQLEYRDNQVWLTCDGTAFAMLSPEMTAANIAETIEGCRRAAVAYRFHIPVSEEAELEAVTILDPSIN